MEPFITKFYEFFIELSFCKQILFASLSIILLFSVICCIVSSIRTKSLSNAFAWASVPAFRASQLYWRLRVIRNGKMCYERFVDEYADVHIKDYVIVYSYSLVHTMAVDNMPKSQQPCIETQRGPQFPFVVIPHNTRSITEYTTRVTPLKKIVK